LAATRVYILAKELGVKSTAIVKKCQNESLDVKNHMSWISAGLAATIREWFSEGEHATTVEMAEKVDLKKARLKKKQTVKKIKARKAKKAKPAEAAAEAERSEQEAAIVTTSEEARPNENRR
jgi:translation initiation factor IF-2